MLTNTACTLYLTRDKKAYERFVCPAVHWEDVRGQNLNKTGSASVDSIKIWIPLAAVDLTGAAGYAVLGDCPFIPTEEHPIRELVTTGTACTITSAARYDFGSPGMQHWEVYAK